MKPRSRPVRNLYFRYGARLGVEPFDIARVLEKHGLITLNTVRDRYTETEKALNIPKEQYSIMIFDLLKGELK